MKVLIGLFLVLFVGCSSVARAQTTQELWQVVTNKLQNVTTNPNFFLLIGNEAGTVFTFQKGNIDGSSSVQIASASKWPMSFVIQRLFEQGILDVYTRAADIIPWWTKDSSDPRSRVTVYHLLTFQSGFNDDASCLNNQASISLEDCAKEIYNLGTATEPGSTFYYSGNHMQILGFMAQNKTGIDWKILFSTYLTTPLNMTARYGGTTNPRLAGGLVTSANEYAKMVRSLYMKDYLLPATINNMEIDRTNVSIGNSPASAYGYEWHYAFGHWVECNDTNQFLPNCATDEYHVRSSAGAFGFYPFLDRTNHYYGVFSTSASNGGKSADIIYSVKDDINAAIKSMGAPPSPSPTPPLATPQCRRLSRNCP